MLLMWKSMGLFLKKYHLLRCWGLISLLNWIGVLILPLLLKLPPRKLEPWLILWSFFLLRLLCLYQSTIWQFMEYWCQVWAGAPSCCLELLDKLQKQICRTVSPSLASSLEPLAHCWNVASLSLFYRYYFGRSSSELTQLVPLSYSPGRSTHYSDKLHDFSVTTPRCYKDVYVNSSFPRNSLEFSAYRCVLLTYDLSGFKSKSKLFSLVWSKSQFTKKSCSSRKVPYFHNFCISCNAAKKI